MLSPRQKEELAARAGVGTARALLVPGDADPHLSSWVDMLEAGLDSVSGGESRAGVLRADEPLPFEELLAGFVLEPARRLDRLSQEAGEVLTTRAHRDLDRHLLQRLCTIASPALLEVFSDYRAALGRGPNPPSQVEASRQDYDNFVLHMRSGEMTAFFLEYCVLARLVATIADLWLASNATLVSRLATDRPEIERIFNRGDPAGPVEVVRSGLSDAHHGGQTVAVLRFASGVRLVYKPRPVGLERAFFRLLDELNKLGFPLQQKSLAVLDRSTYGWVEYAPGVPCHSEGQLRRYYRRAGMLQCLFFLLNATDCHMGNVIACGEYPVLVDAETLLQPGAENRRGHRSEGPLEAGFEDIFQSSFLFSPAPGSERPGADLGALGGAAGQPTALRWPKWVAVNTDRMSMALESVATGASKNLPIFEGRSVGPADFLQEFSEGYRQAFEFFLANGGLLSGPRSPLASLRGKQARVVLRPTLDYLEALRRSMEPDRLRTAADPARPQEGLGPLPGTHEKEMARAVRSAEHESLRRLDVPAFRVETDGQDLILPDGRSIRRCFGEDGFSRCQRRLRRLTPPMLAEHLSLFRVLWALWALQPRPEAAGDDSRAGPPR